ncbi:MAG: Holliday junction resolvase RuvX [Campylobacter sp.]|nr:Holliday junction resolvase RuvX [Campylobacter sp.]
MSETIIAIDVGLKRIGIAISPDSKIALPSTPVLRKNRNQAANEISQILKTKNAKTLVVGIPKGGSSEEEMSRRIRHFVSLLEFDGEIKFIDESFSSFEADELREFSSRKKDGKLDSISAMIILQRYLEIL